MEIAIRAFNPFGLIGHSGSLCFEHYNNSIILLGNVGPFLLVLMAHIELYQSI
jgi:hypothetical protein